MSRDQSVQITFPLVCKVDQGLPRALDDLELTESLELSQEMDHLSLQLPGVMPWPAQNCTAISLTVP